MVELPRKEPWDPIGGRRSESTVTRRFIVDITLRADVDGLLADAVDNHICEKLADTIQFREPIKPDDEESKATIFAIGGSVTAVDYDELPYPNSTMYARIQNEEKADWLADQGKLPTPVSASGLKDAYNLVPSYKIKEQNQ